MIRIPRITSVTIVAVCAALAGAREPALAQGGGLDTLRTRAEASGWERTSTYDDVAAFMQAVADASPWVHLRTFGYTTEGRPLRMAVVGRVADASPESVRAAGRTVVHLQGNIHAGEVEGKEALLALLRQLAREGESPWMDALVLVVVPLYNADGNERVALTNRPLQNGPVGGMGTRPNAQGLDLNRDHTKLESPEARSLVRLIRDYDPHLLVDLHTTNGTHHGYHLTYAPPLHPNTDDAIVRMLREDALPAITSSMESRGWHTYLYGNVPGAEGGGDAERGWYTFDHRPRFGNNYAGLRNRLAILSEAYAYLSFEDRVRVTEDFVARILHWAERNAVSIREATAEADARSLVGARLAVTARFRRTPPVPILMGEVDERRHPLTGLPYLVRRDTAWAEHMPEFQWFDAADTETVPAMYLLPPGMDDVVDRLRAHGVRLVPVDPGTRRVEAFRVDSTAVAAREFQGHRERRVHGAWEARTVDVPPGTLAVPMDQPLGRLAFTLLEPRSDDGFAAWNAFDAALEAGTYPVLRLPAPPR